MPSWLQDNIHLFDHGILNGDRPVCGWSFTDIKKEHVYIKLVHGLCKFQADVSGPDDSGRPCVKIRDIDGMFFRVNRRGFLSYPDRNTSLFLKAFSSEMYQEFWQDKEIVII